MKMRVPAGPVARGWDLVIFDCDGVLVDSEPIGNEVLQGALEALGLRLTLRQVTETFVGKTIDRNLEIIEGMLGRPVPVDFVARWRASLYKEFETRPVRPVDGIEEALNGLGIATAVVSNGPLAKIRTTLGVTGLLPRFEGRIFSPDSGLPGKPSPDLFEAAANAAGADPRRTAVIEDTATGARGARAAGMAVFGYIGGEYPAAAALAEAGATLFDDMRSLPALLAEAAASDAPRLPRNAPES